MAQECGLHIDWKVTLDEQYVHSSIPFQGDGLHKMTCFAKCREIHMHSAGILSKA